METYYTAQLQNPYSQMMLSKSNLETADGYHVFSPNSQNEESSSRYEGWFRTLESLFLLSYGTDPCCFRGYEMFDDFEIVVEETPPDIAEMIEKANNIPSKGHIDLTFQKTFGISDSAIQDCLSRIDELFSLLDKWTQFRKQFLRTTRGLPLFPKSPR